MQFSLTSAASSGHSTQLPNIEFSSNRRTSESSAGSAADAVAPGRPGCGEAYSADRSQRPARRLEFATLYRAEATALIRFAQRNPLAGYDNAAHSTGVTTNDARRFYKRIGFDNSSARLALRTTATAVLLQRVEKLLLPEGAPRERRAPRKLRAARLSVAQQEAVVRAVLRSPKLGYLRIAGRLGLPKAMVEREFRRRSFHVREKRFAIAARTTQLSGAEAVQHPSMAAAESENDSCLITAPKNAIAAYAAQPIIIFPRPDRSGFTIIRSKEA